MNKIRKGDEVVVITGPEKGRRGTVIKLLEDQMVLVEGVNVAKKHQKPNPQRQVTGGIIDKEMPIHRSNIAVWNAATKQADSVTIRTLADGKRVRIFKSNQEVVDA